MKSTVIDAAHLQLLNEIADLAEKVQDGKDVYANTYHRGLNAKQLLKQRLPDLRLIQTREP
jgi:hypothetical protein